jgi:hypothetical protein
MKAEDSREVSQWLLEGDAAIRWQTMRDLAGRAESTVRREQALVAETGWGKRLVDLQSPDGRWGGGIYNPKWTSTTYTLVLLRSLGLPARHPEAVRGCGVLLDEGFWSDGGINFYQQRFARSETCITAMVLSTACWFGMDDSRLDRMAEHLLANQMPDGGWNCRAKEGYGHATHGSFHTTISSLEALRDYRQFRPERAAEVNAAEERGREFLLVHRLYRSHRTGNIVKPDFLRFSFPPRWYYDVLRALDYFAECGAARDARLQDAIDLVQKKRRPDGRWSLENRHNGTTFFELEEIGTPSRWNTLRALRVLRWWNSV